MCLVPFASCLGFAPAYPFGYRRTSSAASLRQSYSSCWLRRESSGCLLDGCESPPFRRQPGSLPSQSRGSMVAFVVGVVIWSLRRPTQPSGVRRRAIVVLFAVALVFGVTLSVRDALRAQGTTINSVTRRIEVAQTTRRLWIEHPYTGVGLRFYKTLPTPGTGAERRRRRGTCRGGSSRASGLRRVCDRITGRAQSASRRPRDCGLVRRRRALRHGLLDIYWTGGTTSLPWIVAGVALATQAVPR